MHLSLLTFYARMRLPYFPDFHANFGFQAAKPPFVSRVSAICQSFVSATHRPPSGSQSQCQSVSHVSRENRESCIRVHDSEMTPKGVFTPEAWTDRCNKNNHDRHCSGAG
jgi:hypothetical protein